MNDASPDRMDKFRRYRAKKRAQGLRKVRLWAIDTHAPGFDGEVERACEAINRSEDSRQAQSMMDDLTAEVWNELP